MVKEYKYSVLKAVRKLKLAENRKPSDVFACLTEPFAPPMIKTRRVGFIPFSTKSTKKKHERKKEYDDTLKAIKAQFSTEFAATLSKGSRKIYKSQFTPYEYQIFSWYCNSCRRGSRREKRKHKELRVSTRQKYSNFINSPEWSKIKNRFWRTHHRSCVICFSTKHVHVHHMLYGEFGKEKDEDLVALCRTHHDEYHAKNGTQRDMRQRTMAFIESKKALGDSLTLHG